MDFLCVDTECTVDYVQRFQSFNLNFSSPGASFGVLSSERPLGIINFALPHPTTGGAALSCTPCISSPVYSDGTVKANSFKDGKIEITLSDSFKTAAEEDGLSVLSDDPFSVEGLSSSYMDTQFNLSVILKQYFGETLFSDYNENAKLSAAISANVGKAMFDLECTVTAFTGTFMDEQFSCGTVTENYSIGVPAGSFDYPFVDVNNVGLDKTGIVF